jgi:hypothetical protein
LGSRGQPSLALRGAGCVRLCVRISSRSLVNRHRFTLRFADAMKVDLGGRSILMAQDPLDDTDGNVVVVHDRCSRMSQGVKPERSDLRLVAEGLDRFSSVEERPGFGTSCLASSIDVIEDPGYQESAGPHSQDVPGIVPAAPKRS